MTGSMMIIAGITLVVLGVVLFIASFIYKNTAGKKIKEELHNEY